MSNRVWFITGTSTGFGRELAEAALEHGDWVAATARKPKSLDTLKEQHGDAVLPLRLDVTKPDEIAAARDAALAQFGRVDVLVNNAGYGTLGAIEEFTDAQVRAQFETNFFGALAVLRAFLPTLRTQKSGHILNVSSQGGLVSFPTFGVYCASKFAIEAVSEAMAAELKPLGVKVTIVEPGNFRTQFGATALQVGENLLPDYAPLTDKSKQWMNEMNGKQPGDPKKAAQAMIRVVEADDPPLRLLLGSDALAAARQKLDTLKANFDTWESVTTGTDYPGATAEPIRG